VTGKGEPSLLSDYIEDETNPNPEGGKGKKCDLIV
jgi:hypothetical protein